ncbi:MAG: ABC transporter substrate-binding protein, partial [Spirochaetia bacterium]
MEEFEDRNPNVTVEHTVVPTEDYMTRIRPTLQSGQNAPGVFAGEAAFVKDLVESGFWEPLDKEPYVADTSDMYPYVPEVGTDSDGVLRAVSWQTTPGATFYRRSIAEEYLGTDDPEEVGEHFSDFDSMIELGRMLKEESDGEMHLLPEITANLNWYLPARENPWVDDEGVFRIDDQIVDHLELSRTLRQEGLESGREAWTPAWFDGMGE